MKMKRITKTVVAIAVLVCLIAGSVSVFAAASEIIINGKTATISAEMGRIVERDNRTLVPVRFLLEYLGFSVEWLGDSQTAVGKHPSGQSFVMQVDNPVLYFFDENYILKEIKMDTVPILNVQEGRTYVPIRFIAEAMEYQVGWDEATQTVTLTK